LKTTEKLPIRIFNSVG